MMTFALVVVSVDGKQVEDQYADAEAVWWTGGWLSPLKQFPQATYPQHSTNWNSSNI